MSLFSISDNFHLMLFRCLLIISSFLLVNLSFGQDDDETKPLPPTIHNITLNPTTGVPTITWEGPAFNPLYPNPLGYIIYRPEDGGAYVEGEGWFEVDTVSSNTLSYTHSTASGLERSIHYNVSSLGRTEPSKLASHHGTIHLTANYDSCGNRLSLDWTHYVGWGNRIERYDIYLGESPRWQDLELVHSVSGTQQSAFITNIPTDKFFYVYVEAKKLVEDLYSRSNKIGISSRVAKMPEYMYIDSIIAGDRQTDLYFRIDKTTEYRKFAVVRWEQVDSISSIFSAKRLWEFTDPSTTFFSDTTDSWAARSRPFYFKINAYDGCNRLKRITSLTNSITTKPFTRGLTTTISWDSLYSANSNPVRYKVYRIHYNPNPSSPELVYEVENPIELSFTDNLSQFEGQGYLPQFCYFVEAYEILPRQDPRLSRSRTICMEVTPDVVMPNAIDPLSNISGMGNPRNLFAPLISFTSSYKLTIYNRWGGIVFQGENKGWNGRLPSGELAKEGAYVYRLEVYTESKRMTTKTGSVTVIYGPQ